VSVRRGKVELATARTLRDLERVSAAHDALSASALVLARTLDEGAGMAAAAVARELRSTLTALAEGGKAGDADPFADIAAVLSAPVEYAPQ
jgi:hypothetical protein